MSGVAPSYDELLELTGKQARHVRNLDGSGFSASIVDTSLFVVNNYR